MMCNIKVLTDAIIACCNPNKPAPTIGIGAISIRIEKTTVAINPEIKLL